MEAAKSGTKTKPTPMERIKAMARLPRGNSKEPWPPAEMQLPSMAELLRISGLEKTR